MFPSKPVILFTHGAYHPPACYRGLTTKLEAAGFEVVAPRLASLGQGVVGITLENDAAVIRGVAESLFESGKEVVLVGHSYGGLVSAIVAKGRSVAELKAQRKQGGLKGVVYLSGTLVKQGSIVMDACNESLATPPDVADIFDIQGEEGKVSASLKNNETTKRYYFYPSPKEETEKTFALLEPHCSDVFYTPSPSSPSDVAAPQTYVIAEQDNAVLLKVQEQIVADAGMKAVRLPDTGHASFLTYPQRVADVIVEVALA
ncbi:hypothetical protein SCUP234_07793 [Seiridium cupressi]